MLSLIVLSVIQFNDLWDCEQPWTSFNNKIDCGTIVERRCGSRSRNFEMLFRNQHGWSHGSPQHGFLGFYNSPGYPKQYNKANKRWVSSLRKQKQRIRRIGRLVQFLPKRALPSSTFVRRLSLLLLLNARWEQTADCLRAFTQTEQAVRREAMLSFLGAIQSNFQLQTVTQSPFVRKRTP